MGGQKPRTLHMHVEHHSNPIEAPMVSGFGFGSFEGAGDLGYCRTLGCLGFRFLHGLVAHIRG